jgi:hypothetical protein
MGPIMRTLALVAACASLLAAEESPPDPYAQELEAGVRLYRRGDYDGALTHFARARSI